MHGGFGPAALLLWLAAGAATAAQAEVLVHVDKASQRMTVTVDGEQRYSWPVSTGKARLRHAGRRTSSRSAWSADHFSSEWDDAPMPHSIFFTQDGPRHPRQLRTAPPRPPASHGCVRLSPANAATLFGLVKSEGLGNTRIEVAGDDPGGVGLAGGGRGFRGLTSFDPLASGIMIDGPAPRRTPRP